ncbi:hypothetical protein, partial [Mycobacterium marinum]
LTSRLINNAGALGQHPGDLLNLPNGFSTTTLGEANPELVQSFAHGLAPYIPRVPALLTCRLVTCADDSW